MRLLAMAALLFLISCQSLTGKEKLVKDITGNWIILNLRHDVTSSGSRELYKQVEDSLSGLYSLKLLSLNREGIFRQLDSTRNTGNWLVSDANELFVSGGGKGFDQFRAIFYKYEKGVLQLKEKLQVENRAVTIIWRLKKVESGDDASSLFEEKENAWRTPPLAIESDTEVKKRVVAMLRYYADYYKLVRDEANYFVPQRVLIPFKFYQHGMGLPKLDTTSVFTRFFYSVRQARLGHRYMDETMTRLQDAYPSSDSYVDGYSRFMTLMGDKIEESY